MFNKGKIKVQPLTKVNNNAFGKDVLVEPMPKLNQKVMNIPHGYHIMPDGTLMSNEEMEYRCGGKIPHMNKSYKQFGGSSKAPQNATIDNIGQHRTALMKNYLTSNMYGSMVTQGAEQLNEQLKQYFNEGGSIHNPDLYQPAIYADALNASKNQFKKDWKAFGNTLQEVVNSDFSGVDGTVAYGANIPIAQDGLNVKPNSQQTGVPEWNPIFTQLGYDQATEEAKWRAAMAADSARFAPQLNAPYNIVDPQGGIGQSLDASGIMRPSPAVIDPTQTKQDPTVRFNKVGSVNSEKEYWDKVSDKNKEGSKNITESLKKKAAQSTVGKTPAQRREIEAAKAAVATDVTRAIRGNVNEDDKPGTSNNTNTNTNNQYYNQAPFPAYGGGKFKIKGVDPVTGKRFKVKYNTTQSPRDYYPNGRGPRVIKYDIYNNPIIDQSPQLNDRNMVNIPPVNPLVAQMPQQQMNNNIMIPEGGFPGVEMPWDYVDISGQPGEFRSRSVPMGRPSAPTNQNNLEQQYVSGIPLEEEAADYANYVTNFKKGGAYFPQPYPGGQEAPSKQALPYFMQDGGSNFMINDLTDAELEDESLYTNFNQDYVSPASTDQNPVMKAKWKANNQGFGQGVNQWAPMALPAMNLISSIAEQEDRLRNERQLQNLKQASNQFTPNTIRNRGKNTVNQGYFDPYNMTPVQFAGNDQGMIGSPNVYSQYGGAIQDGEYYLTEEEIKKVMAMGGQIEYL